MSASHSAPVLVIGGTGKTGRRVTERLTEKGVAVRIGSRSANPSFDWADPSTWAGALNGVRAAYITYVPDLAVPGAKDAVARLIDVAKEVGVHRLVLLSGRGEEEAQATENTLIAAGVDWTIVRCAWFNQNFSEGQMLDQIVAGEVALPVDEVGEPFVDTDDIADVVVAALTDDRHIGQLYELTGPRLLSFSQATAEIAHATGRDIQFQRISHEDFKAGVDELGLSKDIVWLLDELFTRVLDGRNEYLTDGVQRALGRAPRDFADYARDAAASGVWNV